MKYFTLKNVEEVVNVIRGHLFQEEKEEEEEEEEDHWASLGDIFVMERNGSLIGKLIRHQMFG